MRNTCAHRTLCAVLVAALSAAGCAVVQEPSENALEELLRSAAPNADSATLEIFQLRVLVNNKVLTDATWSAVDEQRIDLKSRNELVSNGLRAGVISGSLPEALSTELNLQSEAVEPQAARTINTRSARPRVVRRVVQLSPHDSANVPATDVRDELSVLVANNRQLTGQRYSQVQAVYSLRAEPSLGQRVTVDLTPELHHGQLRNRYSGSDPGIFMLTPSRERQVFDRMRIATELAPGEILVVGCLPETPGSLGHAFHAQNDSGPAERKLILVRLLQVPPSEILASVD